MNILAINTAQKKAFIATSINNEIKDIETLEGERHSESLLPSVQKLLSSQNKSLKDLDVFSVVVGPGSFTGIRIGVSLVKAFLFGKEKKCVAVNSFELLAYNVKESDFFVALNADNRGVYVAEFKNKKQKSIELLSLKALEQKCSNNAVLVIKAKESEYFKDISAKKILKEENNLTQINLSFQKIKNEDFITIKNLEPLYIKLSQAEAQFKEKLLKNIVIEKADTTSLLELEALEKAIFNLEAYSYESLKSELTREDREVLIVKLNDEIISYAICLKTPDNKLEILKIATKETYRKLSLATKLIKHIVNIKADEGFDEVILEVSSKNNSAIALYKKMGFKESYTRKKYYKDGSDAIVMTL